MPSVCRFGRRHLVFFGEVGGSPALNHPLVLNEHHVVLKKTWNSRLGLRFMFTGGINQERRHVLVDFYQTGGVAPWWSGERMQVV